MHLVRDTLSAVRTAVSSPARSARTAVVLGRLTGLAFLVCFATGIYSHLIQEPPPGLVFLTRPVWLYQVSQGLHVITGTAAIPLLFAKLAAVYPNLFQTPLVRSPLHVLERLSIVVFVGSSLVQLVTGLLNTWQWYALFPFPFRQTHFALAFVVIGSLAVHVAVKLDVIRRNWRASTTHGAAPDAAGSAHPEPDATPDDASTPDAEGATPHPTGVTGRIVAWIDRQPEPPRGTSRRGFLGAAFAATAALVLTTAGQTVPWLRSLNLFSPRQIGVGPQSLPVNTTAREAGVDESARADDWTLTVGDGDTVQTFTRDALLALPQHDVELPIACVEGWSTMARWRGVRVADLLDTVGAAASANVRVSSLQEGSSYAITHMGPEFARDPLTLVALELNGETLDLDHGYPARIISPARPGVLQTKWLRALEVVPASETGYGT